MFEDHQLSNPFVFLKTHRLQDFHAGQRSVKPKTTTRLNPASGWRSKNDDGASCEKLHVFSCTFEVPCSKRLPSLLPEQMFEDHQLSNPFVFLKTHRLQDFHAGQRSVKPKTTTRLNPASGWRSKNDDGASCEKLHVY